MVLMMEAALSKGLQKACKELRVVTVEAQELVWRLAPRDWVGKRKAAIAGVARDLGWTFARTWNIAHGRARRIDAHEMDSLRVHNKRLDNLNERAAANRERLNGLIFARHEIARLGQAHCEGRSSPPALRGAPGESEQSGG